MIVEITRWIAVLTLLVYIVFLLKTELHMMQLNSYFNTRYFKWLKENFTAHYSVIRLLIVLTAVLFVWIDFVAVPIGLIALSIWGTIRLVRQKAKKKLDFTPRAIRLFATEIILTLLLVLLAFLLTQSTGYSILPLAIIAAFSFIVIILANTLVRPVEQAINRWYIRDAKKKIKDHSNLIKIGITGSYGKTSVKHFLHAILSEKYNVLMTPGSFNTTLGVVRTIREYLQPIHEVFIAEMGAKKIGDVREICEIVVPKYGILTAIGPQHLETFGSLDNVKKAKCEVITCLPADGAGFVNFDDLTADDIPTGVKSKIVSFSVHAGIGYRAENIAYKNTGMSFDVFLKNEKILSIETRLLGEHNVSNLLACCAIALELGVEGYLIAKAVKRIEAVAHRLEVKKLPNGVTIIDDAFNSNPVGSKMALEALKRFEGKRKIVITPGMIELGEKEYELNHEFGKRIAENCDIAVLVGKNRTQPIQEGIRSTHFPIENLHVCKDLTEANDRVKSLMKEGDIVLYENDLPDTFNE
jgi:UDP-N-acetylmuramoyl-tripeptide--D-alanyl-D-alanine ligase